MSQARIRGRLTSDHLITERRRQEQAREAMNSHIADYSAAQAAAAWESRTHQRIQKNTVEARFDSMRIKADKELERRRQALRDLLAREQQQYRHVVSSMQETTEMRLQRLRDRSQQLKTAREQERQAFVQQQLQRKWRSECDELRHLESKEFTKLVTSVLSEQLSEREKEEQAEREREQEFAAKWRAQQQAALAKDREEAAKRDVESKSIVATLDEQVELVKQRKEAEEAAKRELNAQMVAAWERENSMVEQRLEEKRARQAVARAELDRYNNASKAQREKDRQAEMAIEKDMVATMLAKERESLASEAEKRAKVRVEAMQYRQHLINQMQKEAENEAELQALRDRETEKAFAKRQAQWDREREARERLMQEVYETRQLQIREKELQRTAEASEVAKDREVLRQQVDADRIAEQRITAAQAKRKAEYRAYVMQHMDINARKRADLEEDRRQEIRDINAALDAEEQRIRQELKKDVTVKLHHPLPHTQWFS